MLLPERLHVSTGSLKISNIVIMTVTWILQLAQLKGQPIRSTTLLLTMTIGYALSLCLPKTVTDRVASGLKTDLQVAFLVYASLLLVLPMAFNDAAVNGHGTAIGILVSLLGLPLPYLPRDPVWGLRITEPLARQNWQLITGLVARMLFLTGSLSFVLGMISLFNFLMTVSIGFVSLIVGGCYYWYKLTNRGH